MPPQHRCRRTNFVYDSRRRHMRPVVGANVRADGAHVAKTLSRLTQRLVAGY